MTPDSSASFASGSASEIDRLEAYLHREIPLSAAIGVNVEALEPDRIVLAAPLEPNLNHKATAFGGSISALAILSGWSLVHVRMQQAGLKAELVIRRNETVYLAAIHSRFHAEARLAETADWAKFEQSLRRGRMARIEIGSTLSVDGEVCARFTGEFVAVPQ